MIRCKECKWWDGEDIVDREFYDIEDREENGIPEPPEVRKCKCPKIWFQYEYDEKGNMKGYCEEGGAMYWDGSGYHAVFATTGTFGCVCGKQKPFVVPAGMKIGRGVMDDQRYAFSHVLLDSNENVWIYDEELKLLKLDDDDTEDGGYHIDSLFEAQEFLEKNY